MDILTQYMGVWLSANMNNEHIQLGQTQMNIVLLLIITISASFLSGCQSTGVVPMDGDSYFIGKKDGSPGLGVSLSNKASVYREANDFCQKKGLEVQTLKVNVRPAYPVMLGSTELNFKCTTPSDQAQSASKTEKDL